MRAFKFCCVLAPLAATLAIGGQIILPSNALERDGVVPVTYRLGWEATGQGELAIKWTDIHGRLVEDRKIPVTLNDETEIGFNLDVRRATAMKNQLSVRFTFDGVDKKGKTDHRDETSEVSFIAKPADRKWWDYTILMWHQYPKELNATLKTIGINAGQYSGKSHTPPEFLLENDMRWYAENIATDFYSEYHRWRPDRSVAWAFDQAKLLYKQNPSGIEAFKRKPSFLDASWLKMIHDRLVDSARYHSQYRPVFYSLADESGIADLAAFWDFDFSDYSLVEMRKWLKEKYKTLDALNRQWDTKFTSWDLVIPDTTNEAMKRPGENFSAWADFKEWNDIAYARALKMGVDAVHEVDPEAYVGIGGAQMPGWGGYDYYRLANTLTAVEPYDIGNNIEIVRSVNPNVAVVTTAFARGPWEKHRVWYELLHGNRGMILWDNGYEYVSKDGKLAARGEEVANQYRELRNGIASLLMASERQADPIAIHYSQASMRTEWMLAQRPKGEAWVSRGSGTERMDSKFLRLRESYCRLLEDLGFQYNFVAYGQVEQGELLNKGYRVMILPRSSSLSAVEAKQLREFVEQGGVLIADGMPGAFDEHSRRLEKPLLADLFDGAQSGPVSVKQFGRGKAIYLNANVLDYHQNRLVGKEGEVNLLMGRLLKEAGLKPAFAVTDESGKAPVGVETHTFRNGGTTILSLLSNPQLRVNELGPPEFKSNERFEKTRTITVTLPFDMFAYDVRAAKNLGKRRVLSFKLDPYEPVVFALSPVAVPAIRVAAPASVQRGETGQIGLSFSAPTPAAEHLFHVDVIDPAGNPVPHYSGNVLADNGHATKLLPVAVNDAPGKWQVRVRDLLTGQAQTAAIEVR